MRIDVDREVCLGAGVCVLAVPEIFDQDPDDGRVQLLREHPSADDHRAVRQAVSLCPSGALSVSEGAAEELGGERS
jgi:ferredoxin